MAKSSPIQNTRRYATLAEAAEYLGANERTIRRCISSGQLTGYRLGTKLLRVDLNELDAVLVVIPSAVSS